MFHKKDLPPFKILIISYDFFPEKKPNTYRWFNIASEWQNERNVSIYVISGKKNQFKDFEEINGIKIYRTSEYLVGDIKYKYRENVQGAVSNREISFNTVFKKLIRIIYDNTWSKLYWPDHSFLWIFSAIPVAKKLITEEKIDKIVTVSWTFSAHIIGLYLKKTFKSIFWLADTVDPFSFDSTINNAFLYKRLNLFVEKMIYESANLVSVITDKIRDQYISIFPKLENKFVVNRNIYIPTNYGDIEYIKNSNKNFNLVFIGTLSEEVRSPKNLLFLFNQLLNKFSDVNFTLNIYGDFSKSLSQFNKFPHLLNSSIFLNGYIDSDEIFQVINNADILVNVGNYNKFQEPSKLIEYMYSGKKIINICSVYDDASAEILKNYPLSLNIYPHQLKDSGTPQMVLDFIIKKGIIDKAFLNEFLKEFLIESVSSKYYDCLTKNNHI